MENGCIGVVIGGDDFETLGTYSNKGGISGDDSVGGVAGNTDPTVVNGNKSGIYMSIVEENRDYRVSNYNKLKTKSSNLT